MKALVSVATIVLVCLAGTVQADNLLPNGDFTSGITGWWSAYDGTFSADTSSPDGHNALLEGNLEIGVNLESFSLVAGQQYDLSYMACSPDQSAVNGPWGSPMWARLFWNLEPAYGEILDPVGGKGGTIEQLNAGWATYNATFTMPSGHDGAWLQVCFDTPAGGTIAIDNVVFSAQVPEPSAVVLAITGVIGLLAYAWRKRK